MGLTSQSTGLGALKEMFEVRVESADTLVVALAGNPNTGKSTVFNSLTGLRQHTGNWPGKTVTNAQGAFEHQNRKFILVDLPGTYSLMATSVEEEVARDFICFGKPHATVVVTDATCLERNLNLVLQVIEVTPLVVVCVNLIDEATRKGIEVDLEQLSKELGVPVVGTNARDGIGLDQLKDAVLDVAKGQSSNTPPQIEYASWVQEAIAAIANTLSQDLTANIPARWLSLRLLESDESLLISIKRYSGSEKMELLEEVHHGRTPEEIRDSIATSLVSRAESISNTVVCFTRKGYNSVDRRIDNIVTSKLFGFPIMLALLGLIFWLTIEGANVPSAMLATGLHWVEERLSDFLLGIPIPTWIHGVLVTGVYRTLAWVIAVMLPPMAIFFPLFTLLEDLGYLPRVAFNLDSLFKKACAHGKQALTMCMGFGCNAAGVIACRIIDSPRERLIATITNNFVPCNGRFPTLIALAAIFIAGSSGAMQSVFASGAVLAVIVLGVVLTLVISRLLSATILKGLPSSFTLELPPYRKPQVGRILVRSLLDRTLFVLGRAVVVAAPAGVVIWVMANLSIGDASLLSHTAQFLDPLGRLLGLDGYILMAFILGLPANEIVIPILVMAYMNKGAMLELDSLTALRELLVTNGWTCLTAVCTMVMTLNHFPCGTTLLTIKKETQSWKWTWVSFIVPTVTGIVLCFIIAQGARILGLV